MRVSTSMVGSRNGFGSWEGCRNHNGLKPFGPSHIWTSSLTSVPCLSPLPYLVWFDFFLGWPLSGQNCWWEQGSRYLSISHRKVQLATVVE